MKSNHNFYEEAKKEAISKIHKHLMKYLRYKERFDNTKDTKYKYKAMYHRDIADHIARDWRWTIEWFSTNEVSLRDLGV